jgi:hypothetical protein
LKEDSDFAYMIELAKSDPSLDYSEKIKDKLKSYFGPGPYEFLDPDLVPLDANDQEKRKRGDRKKKNNFFDNKDGQTVHMLPNYRGFGKPEFIDESGLEFKIGWGKLKDDLVQSGDIRGGSTVLSDRSSTSYGTQLLFVRIPIRMSKSNELIDRLEDVRSLKLYHIPTQSEYSATFNRFMSNVSKNRSTFAILVDSLVNNGLTEDIKTWESVLLDK